MGRFIAALMAVFVWASASVQAQPLAENLAQEDDRGFLTGLLEDSLGGEDRTVRIDGFSGAFSRTATIERISVADGQGVWLQLEDVQLEWNRSALLRGRIEIEALTAQSVTLERLPRTSDTAMPAPEAGGFSLPNLPVSVEINTLEIERVALSPPVLGEAIALRLAAQAQLADGSGTVALTAARTDGKAGRFGVDASFDATQEAVTLALDLDEGPEGIAARLLDLPGLPSLRLQVAGDGVLDDLVTDIALDTNGVRRLGGQVVLRRSAEAGRDFALDLVGDLAPLFPAEFGRFFGDETSLRAEGTSQADGAVVLSALAARTGAVRLDGALVLGADKWPTRIALNGQIADPAGLPVLLPAGDVSLDRADLRIDFDASVSETLTARVDVAGLGADAVSAERLRFSATGDLARALSKQPQLQSDIAFSAEGLAFAQAALQRAVGARLDGALRLQLREPGAILLDRIEIAGMGYGATGRATVAGASDAFKTDFALALRADDLAQFSGLAGLELGGQADVEFAGAADLGGAFDLTLAGATQDLRVGLAQADAALAGRSTLLLEAVRDAAGTRVPLLRIENDQLDFAADAELMTGASRAQFDLRLADSAQLDPRLQGPVRLDGTARQNVEVWRVDTRLSGPFGAEGTLSGTVTGAAPSVNFDLRLPDIAPLGAGISGPLSLTGTAAQAGEAWQLDTSLRGLSGTRAEVNGLVRADGILDLSAVGSVPLGLANPFLAPRNVQGQARFDLAVRGRAGLSALSGTVRLQDARFSAPNLRVSLEDIAAEVALGQSRAQVSATAGVSSGGRIAVQGPVTLTSALPAELVLQLRGVRLVDPTLYKTELDGRLTVRGPLAGGALIAGEIDVGETNIQVPNARSTGFAIVPQIVHIGAPLRVRETLRRAGLDPASQAAAGQGGGASYGLNIAIRAPSRIFVRGRGLDAELGGTLILRGTTEQLISAGQFDLVRGRLDILGKRFDLDEGRVLLQGRLDPFLRFVATTTTSVGTASVVIEGPASEPRVRFTSSPEAPEDEVLAQIFFGRDTSQLSAFQALQLASAVATLAGRGGEGVVSKLRRGFGLDDFDVTTDAQGNTGLRVGKYISDNIYTDITVGDENTAGVSVNIDLTPNLTARGQLKQDGESSLGVFFEKDY